MKDEARAILLPVAGELARAWATGRAEDVDLFRAADLELLPCPVAWFIGDVRGGRRGVLELRRKIKRLALAGGRSPGAYIFRTGNATVITWAERFGCVASFTEPDGDRRWWGNGVANFHAVLGVSCDTAR